MSGLAPDLLALALREGWLDVPFLAERLGRPGAVDLAQLPALLADPNLRDLALSARFDGGAYLQRYPDVAASPLPPLVHFLRHGKAEGRSAFANFATVLRDMPVGVGGLWVESHDLGLTGAPLALAHVLAGLARQLPWQGGGIGPVQLAAPCDGPLAQVLARYGGPVLLHGQSAMRVRRDGGGARPADVIARCAQLLARSGVGRVLANSVQSWPMALAAVQLNLPLIWLVHEPDDAELRDLVPDQVLAAIAQAMRQAKALIFVAETARKAWGATQLPQARVLPKALPPPGLDPDLAPAAPAQLRAAGRTLAKCRASDVLVLNVGTISPRKGQIDLIQACQSLVGSPLAAQLVVAMVGYVPSPYAQDIRAQIEPLRQAGLRVQLWPQSQSLAQRRQLAQLIAAADIGVVTSRAESLPLAVAEFFAAPCPVIATDTPGIAPMVQNQGAGRLYPPGQGQALAHQIAALAQDAALRGRMRAQISARAAPQAFEQMIAAYAQVLGA